MAQNGREVPSQFPQVTLGGQKYDIRPLPIVQARSWRQAVKEPLQLIISTVADLPDLNLQDLEVTAIVGLVQHLFSTDRRCA